jgi:two-component system, sensor histidine kinase and response regulator
MNPTARGPIHETGYVLVMSSHGPRLRGGAMAGGAFLAVIVASRRQRAAHALRRAALEEVNAELRAANADLEQFAYVASHDLGEPLRTIAGFAELLQRRASERLTDSDREYVDHIAAGAARARALIDDLLAYARSGGSELTVEPVDAGLVVSDVVRDLSAADRVTAGVLPVVGADRVALSQVFQNLISNGLKFMPDGQPGQVEVGAARDGDGWRFDVADRGIGIAPEHAEDVFGMFRRLNRQDDYAGTGMGLAICRRIVERHGGRIWVTANPTPGGGSTFSFTLPDEPPHASYNVTAASTT